jgi:hypothetical protein
MVGRRTTFAIARSSEIHTQVSALAAGILYKESTRQVSLPVIGQTATKSDRQQHVRHDITLGSPM